MILFKGYAPHVCREMRTTSNFLVLYYTHSSYRYIYVLKSCEGKVPETDLCVSSSRSSSYPYVQDSIISTTTQLKTHLLVQPAEKGISQYLHIEYLSLFGVISIRLFFCLHLFPLCMCALRVQSHIYTDFRWKFFAFHTHLRAAVKIKRFFLI